MVVRVNDDVRSHIALKIRHYGFQHFSMTLENRKETTATQAVRLVVHILHLTGKHASSNPFTSPPSYHQKTGERRDSKQISILILQLEIALSSISCQERCFDAVFGGSYLFFSISILVLFPFFPIDVKFTHGLGLKFATMYFSVKSI